MHLASLPHHPPVLVPQYHQFHHVTADRAAFGTKPTQSPQNARHRASRCAALRAPSGPFGPLRPSSAFFGPGEGGSSTRWRSTSRIVKRPTPRCTSTSCVARTRNGRREGGGRAERAFGGVVYRSLGNCVGVGAGFVQ